MSQTNLMMLILRLQRRTEVFSEVLQTGLVTSVNVDTNQSDKLLRLLDTVVIKLEGGTDEDLKVLDEKPNEYRSEVAKEPILTAAATAAAATKDAAPTATEPKTDGDEANDGMDEDGAVKEVDAITPNDVTSGDKPAKSEEKANKKRKRTTSGSSSSSSSSTSSSGLYFLYEKFLFLKRERERRNEFLFCFE